MNEAIIITEQDMVFGSGDPMILVRRFVMAAVLVAVTFAVTVSTGQATVAGGSPSALPLRHPAFLLVAASGSEAVARESSDDDSLFSLIRPYLDQVRPYLDQVRPYLAPIEAFLRQQAKAFKGFIMEILPYGNNRGQPRAVIDLPMK